MKAIALTTGTTNIHLVDRPEPKISAPDEVKLRVLRVGICGTDREEAAGGRADPPPGSSELIIGHEMFGQVVETGAAVRRVRPGQYGLFTVRRGCGHCPACNLNRSDMCYTGDYTERGIRGRDGYECEYVVDKEQFLVHIPDEIAELGVLLEPMSVAEKAIDVAVQIQAARLPDMQDPKTWLRDRWTLVAGLGPVGLLAAVALRLRGANVLGLDIVEAGTKRTELLKSIAGHYIDGRKSSTEEIHQRCPHLDLIFEATGAPAVEFNLLESLGVNGVYMVTGIPAGNRPITIPGAELMRNLVLRNQVMVGSVNASLAHFEAGVHDLVEAQKRWGDAMKQMITARFPYTKFQDALKDHAPDEIKEVVEWTVQ